MLLPAYTITGFDASAHAAEETIGAAESVPRGIVRSVLVSGVAGWILLCARGPGRAQPAGGRGAGRRGIPVDHERRASPAAGRRAVSSAIVLAQYLCGLATVTSASRMAFAFARDGGLPFSHGRALGLPQAAVAGRRDLDGRDGVGPVHAPHAGLRDDHRRLHDLPLYLVRAADGSGRLGVRPDLDGDGPLEPRAAGIDRWPC